ncbi:DUF3846 domain-containing protein [Neoaquamicrobium sediminum]|uniref:DUF3846 domain-containing protein n=1 Tax=Neoaquamicrobium sediminum TaxID=1849104 RepID=UPI001565BC44|nr:DUF3846 domain-containing protein [Mesorhizobium sediminum]NRC57288.1 DUF3846 domain-containing protein [Mesorhizobium sediminum]
MTISAYLVEVERRTIRIVTIDRANSLADIRQHIGCGLIDMVRIDRSHSVVVDDNGLTDTLSCFTELEDYASPLAGNLLIVGTDAMGETVSPHRSIEDIAGLLTIRYPVFSPVFEAFSGPNVFGSRVKGFEIRVESRKPEIIASA